MVDPDPGDDQRHVEVGGGVSAVFGDLGHAAGAEDADRGDVDDVRDVGVTAAAPNRAAA